MNNIDYKKLINESFEELKNENEIFQYKDIYKNSFTGKIKKEYVDAIIYKNEKKNTINERDTNSKVEVTNDLTNSSAIINFRMKVDILGKILKKISLTENIPKNYGNALPIDLTLQILERNSKLEVISDKDMLDRFINYELIVWEKFKFKKINDSDLYTFFEFVNKLKNNNIINEDKILEIINGFIENNILKINTNNKKNYIILELQLNYNKISEKYSKLFISNDENNLYENKELKYDFIVINKRLLMSNFPIKTKYKIAGSIDYKKILDMSLSIIKKNKNSNIFGVNNILISKFKDSDNNIEILISPNNLFDENKKQLIKEYIKECFKIYSAESISKNKEDFYKIRSDILESLNKLILKISLDQEIGKKTNKNKNKKGKI